jgi:NitT/TauT family transport system substrate-binding protein
VDNRQNPRQQPEDYQGCPGRDGRGDAFIRENPKQAAEIYIRLDNSKLAPDFIEKIITDPEIQYSTTPQNILKYTDFMARVGTLKNKPATWQELFFPDLHDRAGS